MKSSVFLFVALTTFSLTTKTNGQDLSKCKVDFFILESQESFRTADNGKEFILLPDKFPNCSKRKNLKMTKAQMFKERTEKLKENQDYNRDDKKTADSLNAYYRERELEIGNTITWWEPARQATSKDSKKTTDKKESGLKSLIKEAVNPNQTQQQTKTVKEPSNDTTRVENGIFYVKKTRQVRGDLPLFFVQDKLSIVRFGGVFETDTYECPIGVRPIFDITEYKNSIFVLRNESQGNYDFDWKQLDFIVDDKVKISIRNFKIDQGQYKPKIDKSIEILYDKKKLQKIDEFLNSLKSNNLVIVADGEEFVNPILNNLIFNPVTNELKITFSSNGGTLEKTVTGIEDTNYRYDRSYPNKRAKIIFTHLPIYYTDCYNEQIKAFNNLTLRGDAINNPSLNQSLDKAMSASTDWRNFKIERIILTNKSQWVPIANKYTSLIESRYILADAYVTSMKTGKCYLAKDVYFNQKNDPIRGFIYDLFVSVPQELQSYPCNLK